MTAAANPSATATARPERWRPRLHFSPQRHWINDPNGLVWLDGEYHLFYQHNPFGNEWGHMSWGHAVSPDLVNWTERPVAIAETDEVSIYSGSVVVDHANSTGFAAPGRAADAPALLVAVYTGCSRRPEGGQAQHLAFSTDRGRSWQQHAGNPVLDIGQRDFRDPKVFWHAPTQAWVMVVVLPDDRAALFYRSPDLQRWAPSGRFEAPFDGQGIWECPDLIALPVDGREQPLWLFKVDVFGGHPSGGTGARWFCGHFDGHVFTRDTAGAPAHEPAWADGGADFYAAQSWAHLPPPPGGGAPRTVWLAWMNCHRYAKLLPTHPWRGSMTLPRELALRRGAQGWQLLQRPVPELQALRGAPLAGHAAPGPADDLLQVLAQEVHCAELQLALAFHGAPQHPRPAAAATPGDAGPAGAGPRCCGLRLVTGPGEWLELGWDADAQAVYVDRSRAGFVPPGDPLYAGRRLAPCHAAPLRLWVWLDVASVEVFVDDGHAVLTEQFLPLGDAGELQLFSQGGTLARAELQGWHLRPARFDGPLPG